ncbi:MAG: class IV adenylate cyclase [Nocardiopsaceae bacterium]|nr:class IV adenylate cyclase [Nocardiopsaceae bacterium]
MSIEVERKRHLPDGPARVVSRLEELGYKASGPATETDTYFSRPDVDYLATVECLRVRQRGEFAEITYKPASNGRTHGEDDIIAKRETNVPLSGGEAAKDALALLSAVGMVELVTVRKSRTDYRSPGRGGVTVALDEVQGLGWYVETEVTDPDPDAAAGELQATEEALGLARFPVISRSYRDLLLAGPA